MNGDLNKEQEANLVANAFAFAFTAEHLADQVLVSVDASNEREKKLVELARAVKDNLYNMRTNIPQDIK